MLEGIKVVEVAYFYPGPYCTQLLAELGAEVIKIEPLGGEPMRYNKATFAALNRNKKSMFLDLKSEKDKQKFFEVVKDSDVVVEGFRPGVAKKLGIDYESVKKINPTIIYCSISGFGQDSSLKDIPVHDINVMSFAGICKITGLKFDKPTDPNVQLSDYASAMFAAVSILAALIRKTKSGEGCYIDLSMMDSAFASIPLHTSQLLNSLGNLKDFVRNPGYEIYEVKDGFVSLGIMDEPHFWRNLCNVLDIKFAEIGYAERIERYDELKKTIQEKLGKYNVNEVSGLLRKANVPFGIVNSVEDAKSIVDERGILGRAKYDGKIYDIVGFPAVFSNYKPRRDGEVPELE
ncbi:CoA transferase [Archaeoglobales archaeon]|nr:MAG: CoA transferase [Archaeoglobales archaeon]